MTAVAHRPRPAGSDRSRGAMRWVVVVVGLAGLFLPAAFAWAGDAVGAQVGPGYPPSDDDYPPGNEEGPGGNDEPGSGGQQPGETEPGGSPPGSTDPGSPDSPSNGQDTDRADPDDPGGEEGASDSDGTRSLGGAGVPATDEGGIPIPILVSLGLAVVGLGVAVVLARR